MHRKNLVLIGMPGAGKSTIGALAAKTLGMPFIDTDLLLQEKTGRSLQEIIDRDGIPAFLKLEERLVMDLEAKNTVIATGGSIIYSGSAIEHLRKGGILVYLQLPYSEIEKRIGTAVDRGIVIAKGRELFDLYEERTVLYEKQAYFTIDCTGRSIEELVQAVCKTITVSNGK